MEPKISIIVPVYNAEKYLRQCIDSLVNQTYKNIEIICVNDGSTDASLRILERYAATDSRVRVIDKVNTGVSDTRNVGLNYVTGDFLMFLDSDDWIDKETCSTAVARVIAHNADVVLWNYIREFKNESKNKVIFGQEQIVFTENNLKELHRRFVGLYGEELSRPENADSIVPVWGKLYRASVIQQSGAKFVDTNIVGTSEDALFNLQVFGYVKTAIYICAFFNHYRKENISSLTKGYKKNLQIQWKSLYQYIETYIKDNHCDVSFEVALKNRISLSVIGLGFNILRCEGRKKQYRALKQVIMSSDYRKAIEQLDLKYFQMHWKVFFFCAKHRLIVFVYIALVCINTIKGH